MQHLQLLRDVVQRLRTLTLAQHTSFRQTNSSKPSGDESSVHLQCGGNIERRKWWVGRQGRMLGQYQLCQRWHMCPRLVAHVPLPAVSRLTNCKSCLREVKAVQQTSPFERWLEGRPRIRWNSLQVGSRHPTMSDSMQWHQKNTKASSNFCTAFQPVMINSR